MIYRHNKRKLSDYSFSVSKKTKKGSSLEDDKSPHSKKDEEKFDLEQLLNKAHKDEKIEKVDNHIYFYSEVSRDSVFELNLLLKEAEEENLSIANRMNIEPIPIFLHIHSDGGSIFSAFDAIDYIQESKVPVHTIIEGSAASAGTIMSIVGEKRYIRPHAYMLIHQLSSGCWGKMNEIEDEFANLQELMVQIKKLYEEHTKVPKKKLSELLKHDLWWNAEKCIEYGLVDEIWTKK